MSHNLLYSQSHSTNFSAPAALKIGWLCNMQCIAHDPQKSSAMRKHTTMPWMSLIWRGGKGEAHNDELLKLHICLIWSQTYKPNQWTRTRVEATDAVAPDSSSRTCQNTAQSRK